MAITSPITGNPYTKLVDEIPVARIIDLYKQKCNIDVSSYFIGLNNIEVYQCNETTFRFYYPLHLAGDSNFYEQLSTNSHIGYYSQWKWENEIASKYIPDHCRVLDVGCGDAAFLSELSKRKKNMEGVGLELNPDALKKSQGKGLKVYHQTIQDFVPGNENCFDVVTSFQVLEHIVEVGNFLEAQLKVLKAGGIMIIGVPYCNPYLYKNDKFDVLNLPPHHMGLWNERAFKNLESIYRIKLKACYTSKLHDIFFYYSVQLNMRDKYIQLYWSNKVMRMIFRVANKLLFPLRALYKGHDIVAIFEKI